MGPGASLPLAVLEQVLRLCMQPALQARVELRILARTQARSVCVDRNCRCHRACWAALRAGAAAGA